MRRIVASTAPGLLRRRGGPGRLQARALTTEIERTTKEGDPGEIKEEEGKRCDKEEAVAAGRIVTPELDKQSYAPEGMGMDPAEQGSFLKPGDSGGGEEHWEARKKGKKKQTVPLVEDKITGEKLRDTDVLADRKSG